MKKWLLMSLMMLLMMGASVTWAAEVNVQLNGDMIDFTDASGQKVEAQIMNSRTMVPMRKIFELLKADVTWEGETQTVLASKGDTLIKLQIGNAIAEVSQGGKTKQITLDAKPVIVENRTLVPLRFISETLGKQVGWDAQNRTAIIIDYDYFLARLQQKSPILAEMIVFSPKTMQVDFTRTYTDLQNGATSFSKITVNDAKVSKNQRNLDYQFSGNSQLFSEIVAEGWGNGTISVSMKEDGISYQTSNAVLSRMLTQKEKTYDEMGLMGSYEDTFADAVQHILGAQDTASLSVSSFSNMKQAFETFLGLFAISNTATSSQITAKSINYYNANFSNIDYMKFDNLLFDNEFLTVYQIFNQLIFHYDATMEELLYDYSQISMSLALSKQEKGMTASVTINMTNDYEEKVVYTIQLAEQG